MKPTIFLVLLLLLSGQSAISQTPKEVFPCQGHTIVNASIFEKPDWNSRIMETAPYQWSFTAVGHPKTAFYAILYNGDTAYIWTDATTLTKPESAGLYKETTNRSSTNQSSTLSYSTPQTSSNTYTTPKTTTNSYSPSGTTSRSYTPASGCSSVQCSGTTQKGARCRNRTTNCNGRCYLH